MDKQTSVYQRLYQKVEFDFDLPDYKITGGKRIIGKKILVLGVGTGRDVRFLCKNNEVWGIDTSRKAVKIASRWGIKGMVGNLSQNLKYKGLFFDVVIAKDIFEHLADPMKLLKEMKRILRPGGYVVINIPNQFFWGLRFRIFFGQNLIWKTLGHDHTKLFNEWDYMHVRFFTWGGFKKFLRAGGFKISRAFWDFGTLAHYSQPELVFDYLEQKGINSVYIKMMIYFWNFFNFLFPRRLRSAIVAASPSLFCASFYVWCRKVN